MATFKSEIETMTWEMTMTDRENRQRHRRWKPQQQHKQETKTTKAQKEKYETLRILERGGGGIGDSKDPKI